jgi:hypothetical protein
MAGQNGPSDHLVDRIIFWCAGTLHFIRSELHSVCSIFFGAKACPLSPGIRYPCSNGRGCRHWYGSRDRKRDADNHAATDTLLDQRVLLAGQAREAAAT